MPESSAAPLSGAKISALFIYVQDLDQMLAFYRDALGLRVFYEESGQCAFLQSRNDGGPAIALYPGRIPSPGEKNHWFLVFDVDDVERCAQGLRRAGVQVGEVFDVPYGRATKFSDPEGNIIEIHQPNRG